MDHGYGNARQEQEWVESEVAKSFRVGFHSKGPATRHVRTYRCPRCGYLESYADDSDA